MPRIPCALGCTFALLSLALNAATPDWRWSNPLPHGNDVNDFGFRTNRGYVQVCDEGQIYTSADSVAWTRHDLGIRQQVRAVEFFGTRLVATGESGLVVWSDDLVSFHPANLGTANWLEGLAASPTRLVAVGDNAALYTSDTGTNWTLQPLPAGQQAWFRGAAWGGNSPGFFVVVGEDGMVLTSPDGITWTKRTVTADNGAHLNRVAPAGGGFVVVGDGGTVIFGNAAGTSWVRQQASGATGDLNAAVAASATTRLVVGEQEARLAVISGNSVFWTPQTSPSLESPAPIANFLSAIWDNELFLLGGRTGLLVFGQPTLASGEFAWSTYPSPTRNWLFDLTTATACGTNVSVTSAGGNLLYTTNRTTNTFYVAAGDRATLLNSDDGIRWATSLAPASATNRTYFGVAGNLRGLVAAGSGGTVSFSPVDYSAIVTTNRFTDGTTTTDVVLTNWFNTLGLAWYAVAAGTTNDLQAVAASDNRYVIGGANGFLATSDDGTNWTAQASGTTRYLSGVEAHPGGFVAVGDAGTILTSPDGLTWTNQISGTTNWLYRVRFADGQFVAVGQNGTIATSTDTVTWALHPTGLTTWLNDVEFTDGKWYAVGNQGTVLISPDGRAWTRDTALFTRKSLYTVATLRGQLVTAGIEGVILRAQVGPWPRPVTLANYPRTPAESVFLFVGSPDQSFQLERATDLLSWEPESSLEIADPSGALLYLSPRTNDPNRQWFRAVEPAP